MSRDRSNYDKKYKVERRYIAFSSHRGSVLGSGLTSTVTFIVIRLRKAFNAVAKQKHMIGKRPHDEHT